MPDSRNESPSRPNVILIIMDDLAWGDLACHGNPSIHTPHLDSLHADSARLTRTCSGPLCTPARAMLMTGRYAQRTKAIDTWCGRSILDPDEITLAKVLADVGYATCISGKWHLGDNYPSRAMDMGFDESLVHLGGGLRQPGNPGHWANRDGYFDSLLSHNGVFEPSTGYCTDIFTDHALTFIEQHREEPFFVYLATNAPHSPLEVDEQWARPYLDMGLPEAFARLYGMVANIDMNMGRVLQRLDQLNLRDDTIVLFTSDHGPCHGADDEAGRVRFNAGLRDAKGTMYEGGVRVPCFWSWPARIPRGRDIDRIASPIDIMPTLAAACGASLPTDRTIDGTVLLPLLTDEMTPDGDHWPDRRLFLQWHRGDVPELYRNCLVRTQRFKLVDGRELYDIEHDEAEEHDISGEHPELVAELRLAYEAWFQDVSHTRPDNYAPPAIVVGTKHESPTMLNRNDRRAHGRNGWTDDTHGHWVVHFTKPRGADYDVTVEFAALGQAGTVHLICGSAGAVTRVAAGTESAVFSNLAIPPGLGNVEAWVTMGNDILSARYIHIQ